MKVELSQNEIRSIIDSVIQEKYNYENNALKYRVAERDPTSSYHVENYYKSIFLPTIQEFDDRIDKLRKIRDEMAVEEKENKNKKRIDKK